MQTENMKSGISQIRRSKVCCKYAIVFNNESKFGKSLDIDKAVNKIKNIEQVRKNRTVTITRI